VSPIEILFTPAATQSPDVVSTSIFIKAHVKIDDFYFNPNDLLFAKAEGNYVTLNILKDGHLKTELKRISLKQFEQQLTEFPNLIRCHRAYLINLQQVIKFSGNSQGYLTYFNGTADKIPVSRAYLDVFDQTYKQLSLA
jgi:DNA-binding LytR/AlgR family response regulator